MDLATLGNIFLSIVSGAGGAALLELWWKPRRDRRKAAGMLLAEIAMNTELLLFVAHSRDRNPRHLPADLHLSRTAWDAAANLIPELHTELVRSLLLLYNRYRHQNDTLAQFLEAFDQYQSLPEDSPRRPQLQGFMDSAIDVYQTGVDAAISSGQELLPPLTALAGWHDRGDPTTPGRDYGKEANAFLKDREERIRRMGQMGKGSDGG